MKASARLVKAIIALFASVVLCIGICLAWFSSNSEVDANGMDSFIKSTNIDLFTITAIKLTDKDEAADGTVSYTVGDEISDKIIKMEEYGNMYGNPTALLLKFECTFIEETGKYYDIGAAFSKLVKDPVAKDSTGECDLMCNLSEVLSFFGTDITTSVKKGDTVTLGSTLTPAEGGDKVIFNGGEAYDGDLTYTFYCVVDYNDGAIGEKYAYALNHIEGCSLNSQMRFQNDMSFYVSET